MSFHVPRNEYVPFALSRYDLYEPESPYTAALAGKFVTEITGFVVSITTDLEVFVTLWPALSVTVSVNTYVPSPCVLSVPAAAVFGRVFDHAAEDPVERLVISAAVNVYHAPMSVPLNVYVIAADAIFFSVIVPLTVTSALLCVSAAGDVNERTGAAESRTTVAYPVVTAVFPAASLAAKKM